MILSRRESVCIEISAYLRERGYSVVWCTDYTEAMRMVSGEKHRPELLLYDMAVPTRDEYEVIRQVREYSDVRMLILSEDDRLDSQLYAYSLQIDDYMCKPVALPLIEAHMEAVLRRYEKKRRSEKTIGALTIDYVSGRISLAGELLKLTAMEYDLMVYFIEHKGMILSRDKILDSVWGYDYVGGYRSVDTLVKKLRAKLTESYPYIRTIYGVGYCFDIE